MKQFIGMIILVFWGSSFLMSQQYHYYYQGEQIPMDLNTEYAYLQLEGITSPVQLGALIGDAEVTKFGAYNPAQTLAEVPGGVEPKADQYWAEIHFAKRLAPDVYYRQLAKLNALNKVVYVAPYFSKGFDEQIGLSDLFVVELQDLGDPDGLVKFAKKQKVEIIGQNRFMPEFYTLKVTPASKGNALDMANLFYESGRFASAVPDLMVDELHCVNDPFFNNQWGFQNTGQWGGTVTPDINACAGWANWSTGTSSVIVAILDHGFEQNHPDLNGNNFGTGFDSESGTTPALVLGSHGTACAGIVAAERNNLTGVVGVAPDCSIMSISNSLAGSPNSRQKRADGINWAWMNGAAVISNSWGSGVQYPVIDASILNAQTNGRGGLGTVICFSAGNNNVGNVSYPGNVNDDIIAVGAMSPCGERKNLTSCDGENFWGSSWGTDLDVMAPGVKVPTTDRQGGAGYTGTDYTQTFNGTSAACPHVAGLAGMIIGMNPCLTQRQVADIIERSAQKIGSYTYSNTAGRDNGNWNIEMGYGLIDVDAALEMTRELYIQNVTLTGAKTFQVRGKIFAGSNVDPGQPVGPVNINAGADVKFRATTSISMEAGFNVNLGAIFDAAIISTSCASWDNSARQAPPAAVLEPIGAIEETETATAGAEESTELSIKPNPFEDELTLGYHLMEAGRVEASLFNLQGQRVAQLIPTSTQEAGYHKQTIQVGNSLPDGIYFVRLQVDERIYTRKLVNQ